MAEKADKETPADGADEEGTVCGGLKQSIASLSFPYMEYLPKPDQAKGVQIDDRPDRIAACASPSR